MVGPTGPQTDVATWAETAKQIVALQLMGYPPLKLADFGNKNLSDPLRQEAEFLCRFQYAMALSGNFFGPMHYILPGKQI